MRKTAATILILMLLAAAIVAGGSFYMLGYSLSADPQRSDTADVRGFLETYPGLAAWNDSMRRKGALRDTFVMMPTGERHHALIALSDTSCGRTAIVVHGYHDKVSKFVCFARMFHQMGYNVVMPELHAHGLSDGEDVQMGWKDRHDMMTWIHIADSMSRCSGEPQIVLHGVSMGAATVMSTAGEKLPPSVKAVVEDCGYNSVWDEFSQQLKDQFSLPEFPLMYTTSALCKLKYGWSFGEADMERQVAKSSLPMMFIHGGNDTFVPTRMVGRLYNAKKGLRRLFIGKGSEHAMTYADHTAEYTRAVEEFLHAAGCR